MSLTALTAQRAKPRAKAYKLSDERGLYLLVNPNGSRYWRLNYSFEGKPRTLSMGVYPDVGLADARERRDRARQLVASGIDPADKRKQDEEQAKLDAASSFRVLAEEWLEKRKREGLTEVTLDKARWLLDFAFPSLGDKKVAEIKTLELLEVLRAVEKPGRHESARRLRSVCGRVFRYAIATGRAEHDLTANLRDALITPKTKHHAAITEPEKVGQLLRAIDGFDGQDVTRLALQLAPHVFVRPGELRQAEWSEIDLDKAVWSIPAEKMKMRRPHRVPLSQQALAILSELRAISYRWPHVFPGFVSPRRPMSENTLNAALRRMGYSGEEMTSHGFRAMASTLLNEMGRWNPDAIERQLAHAETDSVRKAYARGEYWDERVRMMQAWSDYLDELRVCDAAARQFATAAPRGRIKVPLPSRSPLPGSADSGKAPPNAKKQRAEARVPHVS